MKGATKKNGNSWDEESPRSSERRPPRSALKKFRSRRRHRRRNPATTTPPHPVSPSATPPKLKNSQPVPPPQSQNLTQGGEHLRLAEVEPVGGLVDTATVVYDPAALDDVIILTSIALYRAWGHPQR